MFWQNKFAICWCLLNRMTCCCRVVSPLPRCFWQLGGESALLSTDQGGEWDLLVGEMTWKTRLKTLRANVSAVTTELSGGHQKLEMRTSTLWRRSCIALPCTTFEVADGYWQVRPAAAWLVVEVKTCTWEESGVALEDHFGQPQRSSGKPSGALIKGIRSPANTIYSAGRKALITTGNVVRQWMEYF